MIDAMFSVGQGMLAPNWWSALVWPVLWNLIKIVAIVLPLLGAVAYLTLWERKLLGFMQVRVRHHGDVARIEVEPSEISRLAGERERVVRKLREAGYKFVSLDLEGYATGSLNRTWKPGD